MKEMLRMMLGFFLLVILLVVTFSPLLMGLAIGISLGGWHIPLWAFLGFIAMALIYGRN